MVMQCLLCLIIIIMIIIKCAAVLPIASCGLRHDDDEAVRVAVALRLGPYLCIPHACRCGSQLDARGLHAFRL